MIIAIGSDDWSHVVHETIEYLKGKGHHILYTGAQNGKHMSWPSTAKSVAGNVAKAKADFGVLFCWTGTGVSIAANKVRGIRAALCGDAETARGARLWNNANILCLSLRKTTIAIVQEILNAWINIEYIPNPEDDACLAEIEILDTKQDK